MVPSDPRRNWGTTDGEMAFSDRPGGYNVQSRQGRRFHPRAFHFGADGTLTTPRRQAAVVLVYNKAMSLVSSVREIVL